MVAQRRTAPAVERAQSASALKGTPYGEHAVSARVAAMEREWARLEQNEQPTVRERADAWLSRVNAAQAARDIVRMLYDAVGSAAIYSKRSPLDRALRDAETFCQHIVSQRKTLEMVGAMLLNADTPLLPYI